jgi:molybdopterin/thiamine biosynthesis adenylyltransferase
MRPQLKHAAWARSGEQLVLVYDVRERLVIADPDGTVEDLLTLLRAGGRTVGQLADELGAQVAATDVAGAIALLDQHGLLEDGQRLGRLDQHARERFFSNLAFFEVFARLDRGQEDFQRRLSDAHVLVLGTGGLNSNTIPHLCGLGIGRLTLLDRDTVELRNFARQYLYRHADLGARKVFRAADWVRGFDPTIKVDALDTTVTSADDVAELVDRLAPDLVMSGIDQPEQVDDWVNAGCVTRGVPYIRGGMSVTQGTVWSVAPGTSACRACQTLADSAAVPAGAPDQEAVAVALYQGQLRRNRGIGPVAGLLGALASFEVLRYLTRYEPPVYAGRPLMIDFADGCAMSQPTTWQPHPACPVCGTGRE